jgi:type II secretory pathway component PulF
MSLFLTPRQLERRAEFYHQLGVLLSAGMTLHQGLEQIKRSPPDRSLGEKASRWLEYLTQGSTVTQAVRQLGKWMPAFDEALIDAAEQSGRLDACFKLLALYYRERAQLVKQTISDLLYPLFVLHVAVFLFPFIDFVKTGNVFRYVVSVLAVLVPLYGAALAIIVASQGRHGENWRATLERLLRRVPVLGVARRDLALARLAAALEALLNAGVPIIGAWELAATASGSPELRRTVYRWRTPLTDGASTPAELVADSGVFPDIFANLYHTGEVSGTLDQSLGRLHNLYQEEGLRRMRLFAQWTPRLVYFAICIVVGWRIITSYAGYVNQLNDVMDIHAR